MFLFLLANFCPSPASSQTGPSLSPGSAASGDTSNQKPTAESQPATSPSQSGQNPSSTELNPVIVIGQLDQARDQIVPYLGATKYSIGQQQIQTQSQGAPKGVRSWIS
jgi:hypothetical protein